jgi:hypothetical protein
LPPPPGQTSCACKLGDPGCSNPTATASTCKYVPGVVTRTASAPGQLMLELQVTRGTITFYPQPPQFPTTLKPGLVLLERGSPTCFAARGCTSFIPCKSESRCWSGSRVVTLLATLDQLQFAITNRYITYVPDRNYYGDDSLSVSALLYPLPILPHPVSLSLRPTHAPVGPWLTGVMAPLGLRDKVWMSRQSRNRNSRIDILIFCCPIRPALLPGP